MSMNGKTENFNADDFNESGRRQEAFLGEREMETIKAQFLSFAPY